MVDEPVVEDKGLLVNELFGPVWQGEGRQAGQLAAFLRLGGCNLACSWCDTPHAVFFDERKAQLHREGKAYDPQVELVRLSVGEVLQKLAGFLPHGGLLIVSGGEPMLQRNKLDLLVTAALAGGLDVAFETAGTIHPGVLADKQIHWTVSPKLNGSGNELGKRFKPEVLYRYNELGADFKFVVTNPADMAEVRDLVEELGIPHRQVWIMPEGTTRDDVLWHAHAAKNFALANLYNFTLRQHVLLYGNERGR
jgi:7-carboxy-7-deazaguanine synthase